MKNEIIPISLGNVKVYLIKGEKWVLVDTGFAFSYKMMLKAMEKHQINPEDISLIIITHNHLDHVGGLVKLQKLTNAKVLIHRFDGEDLRNGISSVVKPVKILAKIIFKLFHGKHVTFEPHIEIDGDMDLSEFGLSGKIIHTPGHTPGSVSILLDNGDCIIGDLISGNKKKAKLFYVIDDINELKSSLKKLIQLGAKRFYTSHAKVCDVEAVEKLLD
ncbi:MBL fold metallo-hydrolase [Mycoplasmatota bacterium]|nr:MBL fold metallo-hydrolase [Mycoplasmatota bacterium]